MPAWTALGMKSRISVTLVGLASRHCRGERRSTTNRCRRRRPSGPGRARQKDRGGGPPMLLRGLQLMLWGHACSVAGDRHGDRQGRRTANKPSPGPFPSASKSSEPLAELITADRLPFRCERGDPTALLQVPGADRRLGEAGAGGEGAVGAQDQAVPRAQGGRRLPCAEPSATRSTWRHTSRRRRPPRPCSSGGTARGCPRPPRRRMGPADRADVGRAA